MFDLRFIPVPGYKCRKQKLISLGIRLVFITLVDIADRFIYLAVFECFIGLLRHIELFNI